MDNATTQDTLTFVAGHNASIRSDHAWSVFRSAGITSITEALGLLIVQVRGLGYPTSVPSAWYHPGRGFLGYHGYL